LVAEADALAVQREDEEEEDDEVEVAEEEDDDDDDDDEFEWSDNDGTLSDEATDQQRALVESFEPKKKLQDDAREDAQIRRIVELFLQTAQQGRAVDDTLLEAASGLLPT
jgi:hypothetical protein